MISITNENENEVIEQPLSYDKQCSINIVESLYEKYADDVYMHNKLNNYFNNHLSTMFDNMQLLRDQRILRIDELSCEQDIFIESFLNNNQYFYNSTTSNYFFYDGLKYILYNEDDILHHVLTSISRGRNLMSWKQKTKINIMKRIRDNTLMNSIPESNTIQMVINALYPVIFETKNAVKYFLTILGDNILRKNTSNIHFINQTAKNFMKNMNNISQMLIGSNISQTFKFKYHDHTYNNCRLVDVNDCIKNDSMWSSIINIYALDILCVSMYYSNRYSNADYFITNVCNDTTLENRAFFIKNIEPSELINEFIDGFIDIDASKTIDLNKNATQITWKNMQYLWRLFLDSKHIPSIIFLHTLKPMLINRLDTYYNVDIDSFIGICSKYIPSIHLFLHFWNNAMINDNNEDQLEIDEILSLLRTWCDLNNECMPSLTDKQLLDIIDYYIPSVIIEDDKYISNIRCVLWNKSTDIINALTTLKNKLCTESTILITELNPRPLSPAIYKSISIYDAYQHYCKYITSSSTKLNSRNLVVSKSYFENFIYYNLNEYIIDDTFISPEWYMYIT